MPKAKACAAYATECDQFERRLRPSMSVSLLTGEGQMTIGPKRKDRRHYSYDEAADEPPALIEKESTDIEREHPIDDTEPMEQVDEKEGIAPPIFQE